MNDSKIFFTLIAIAYQFFDRALFYEKLGEKNWKEDSFEKYKATLLIIAELFTCTDVGLAEELVGEYGISNKTKYINLGFLVTEDDEEEDDD